MTGDAPKLARVCVFGAGALGGAVAARLGVLAATTDLTVTVIARGAQLAAIGSGGLRLWERGAERPIVARVIATDDPQAAGEQDLVITALKGHQLPAAAAGIAALLGERTRVLTILNGVPWWLFHGDPASGHEDAPIPELDPEGALGRLVGPERVIGCVAYHSCETGEPGHIHLKSENRFAIGEPSGADTPDLAAIASLLERSGWTVTRTERIRNEIWRKLVSNAAFNPVSALTRAAMAEIMGDPAVVGVVRAIMAEVRAVGETLGAIFVDTVEQRLEHTRHLPSFRTSMLQDLDRGRALEVAPLLGAVTRLGRLCGVPTPMVDTIGALTGLLDRVVAHRADTTRQT